MKIFKNSLWSLSLIFLCTQVLCVGESYDLTKNTTTKKRECGTSISKKQSGCYFSFKKAKKSTNKDNDEINTYRCGLSELSTRSSVEKEGLQTSSATDETKEESIEANPLSHENKRLPEIVNEDQANAIKTTEDTVMPFNEDTLYKMPINSKRIAAIKKNLQPLKIYNLEEFKEIIKKQKNISYSSSGEETLSVEYSKEENIWPTNKPVFKE